MANTNFTVHNGLTVGPTSIDATSGNISTTATFVTSNNTASTSSATGALVISGGVGVSGAIYANLFNASSLYAGTIGNTGSTLTGTLSTAAQTNITSIGTLGSLTVTGAVQANTHTGVAVYAGTIGNTGTTLTGTLSTAAQTNITSVGTLTSLTVTGAVNANTFSGVAVYAVTIGNTGATLTGTLSTAAQTNITSVGTLSSLATSGVITSGGNINVTSATNSTSSTTGSIVTAGGIGVAQDMYVGGKLYVGGNTTFINTTIINTTDTLSAPTIQAGTIGNSGAVLYGTLNSSSASQTNITAVGTLTSLNSGAITTTGTLAVNASGGITTNQTTFLLVNATATTIDFGGAATTINVGASGGVNFVPTGNAVSNLGSTGSGYWNNVYAVNFLGTSTTAKYADLAERYTSDANYEPGTVVDFGGDAEVTLSNIDESPAVAGVVSTNPAYMMNSDADGLYIALVGRVPTKVTGPVRKGQMMVSNGDGTARSENNPAMGSVIGKALENFSDGVGVIEVVVGRL